MTLAIGFFDGVHLGHQAILQGADFALTFENHPLSVVAPERAPKLIMSWEERAKAIMALGVKVTALEFDTELASYSPERFLELLKHFATAHGWKHPEPLVVRCGANWRFGKNGAGDATWLRKHGVEVTVVPYAQFESEAVSSTRIRQALRDGRIKDANAMLGRTLLLKGEVTSGKGLGTGLGFPTLNVNLTSAPELRYGVYAVKVEEAVAIANYGFAPTCGDRAWKSPVMEIHFPTDAWRGESAAGTRVGIELVDFVRDERKFASLDELRAQIAADCKALKL